VHSSLMALVALDAADSSGDFNLAIDIEAVCRAVGETNRLLGSIGSMLANPLSTSAAERFRRGVHALPQGWYEPALKELDACVERDPSQSLCHFARGLALGALERNDESLAAFRDAIMFTGKDPALLPVLAGASILAAQAAH